MQDFQIPQVLDRFWNIPIQRERPFKSFLSAHLRSSLPQLSTAVRTSFFKVFKAIHLIQGMT